MSLVNIISRSNSTFCFSQNQTTYSVAFLVTAWLVIVEGFDIIKHMTILGNLRNQTYDHISTLLYMLQLKPEVARDF